MRIQPAVLTAPQTADSSEANIREAAKDFEALLIAQLLHSFRTEPGSDGSGADSAASSSTMLEFAEQHLSQVISRQGGLGLHELIVQGLLRKPASTATTERAGDGFIPAPTWNRD